MIPCQLIIIILTPFFRSDAGAAREKVVGLMEPYG